MAVCLAIIVAIGAHALHTLRQTTVSEITDEVESENGERLIESLRQTFYDYGHIDEFNLTIEGD